MKSPIKNISWYIDDVYDENSAYSENGFGKLRKYRYICRTMHGWLPSFLNIDPKTLIGTHYPLVSNNQLIVVHRKDQSAYLRSNGFPNSEAIGSPFVYLPKQQMPVRKNYLIIANHGVGDNSTTGNLKVVSLVDEVKNLGIEVGQCSLLVHDNDKNNREYLDGVKETGLEIVIGAKGRDCSTFSRLADVFSSSVATITNCIGSHIVYANYFGCPVLFTRKIHHVELENYFHLPGMDKLGLELAKRENDLMRPENVRKHYPFLFENKYRAYPDWAAEELGEDQKKSPQDLAKLFGWNFYNDIRYFARKTVSIIVPEIIKKKLR